MKNFKFIFNKFASSFMLIVFVVLIVFSSNSAIYTSLLGQGGSSSMLSSLGVSENQIKENYYNFNTISNNLSEKYTLLQNIDSIYGTMSPIGSISNPFTGEFDGRGFTITLNAIETTTTTLGFFGATENATIKNLTVIVKGFKPHSSSKYIGGICGYAKNTTFENCKFIYNDGIVVTESASLEAVGGICGYASNSTFKGCINNTNISVYNATYVGGIVGNGSESILKSSINYGQIIAVYKNTNKANAYVGGLSGYISYCPSVVYNAGNIEVLTQGGSTSVCVGGISGILNSTTSISDMFNMADILVESDNVCKIGGIFAEAKALTKITQVSSYGNYTYTSSSNPTKYCGGVVGHCLKSITLNNVYSEGGIVTGIQAQCYIGGIIGKCDGSVTASYTGTDVTIFLGASVENENIKNCGNIVGSCTSAYLGKNNYVYQANKYYGVKEFSTGLSWGTKYYRSFDNLGPAGYSRYFSCRPIIYKEASQYVDDFGSINRNLADKNRYYYGGDSGYDNYIGFDYSIEAKELIGYQEYLTTKYEYWEEFELDLNNISNNQGSFNIRYPQCGYYSYLNYPYWEMARVDTLIDVQLKDDDCGVVLIQGEPTDDYYNSYNITSFYPSDFLQELDFDNYTLTSSGNAYYGDGYGIYFEWILGTAHVSGLSVFPSTTSSTEPRLNLVFVDEMDFDRLVFTQSDGYWGNTKVDKGEKYFEENGLFNTSSDKEYWYSASLGDTSNKIMLAGQGGLIIRYDSDRESIVFEIPLAFINTSQVKEKSSGWYFGTYELYSETIESLKDEAVNESQEPTSRKHDRLADGMELVNGNIVPEGILYS